MPRGGGGREPIEDRVVREISEEDEEAMKSIVADGSRPPDSEHMSEADEDLAWDTRDGQVDYDQIAPMLMTQGLPPEMVQQLLIVKLRGPEWAQALMQPTQDAEQAHYLAHYAQYPFKLGLLDGLDPDEQVKKSNVLERRRQKRVTSMQQGMAQTMGAYDAQEGTPQ